MASEHSRVSLRDVTVRYPLSEKLQRKLGKTHKVVLNGLNLDIEDGNTLSIVGPSGSGKSTFFRVILGTQKPTSGTVKVAGVEVERVSPDKGIVYQSYSVFPHMTVIDNIAAGPLAAHVNLFDYFAYLPIKWCSDLTNRLTRGKFGRGKWWQKLLGNWKYHRERERHRAEAMEYLAEIGLAPEDAEKYPMELSGGMSQRVAVARALIMRPNILMMDEPFGALDPSTREEMQLWLLDLQQKHGITILFVTHDITEACFIGNRIVVLSPYGLKDDGSDATDGSVFVMDERVPWEYPQPPRIMASAAFGELRERVSWAMKKLDQRKQARAFEDAHPG